MRGYVAKKGNRYYAVIYEGIDPGTGKERRRWVPAGTRKGDAEKLVTELVHRHQQGDDLGSGRATLSAYLTEHWLPIQEARLRPTTYLSYEDMIRLHVTPHIGRIKLNKLQAKDLDSLYARLLREGRQHGSGGLSTRTVRYLHAILSKALGDAHRKGVVSRNVATMADPPKTNGSKRKTSIHVWNARDLRRFLRLNGDSAHHDLYLVAANTGMRRGELLGLRWEDVDLDAGTISIHRTVVTVHYEIHASDVKTDTARRTIDLNKRTITVLRQRRERLEGDDASSDRALVFGKTGQEPCHPERISKTFDRLVDRHGLPAIRFHDLRHTHASLLLKAGVPVKVVSERLGHASPGFTLNVYQHVLPGMQAEAAQMFDEMLDEEEDD